MSNYVGNNQLSVVNGIPDVAFHPQLFENINQNPGKKTDLARIQEARGYRLPNVDISDLKSPGGYTLTPKTKIKGSLSHDILGNLQIETLLSSLFFSRRNIQDIQKLIRMVVYQHMNQVIDDQSETELLIIMRSLYLEYALAPPMLESAKSEEEENRL